MAAVRVKQHVAQGQLKDNTAHRPDVARMGPACAKKNKKMFVYDENIILKCAILFFPLVSHSHSQKIKNFAVFPYKKSRFSLAFEVLACVKGKLSK